MSVTKTIPLNDSDNVSIDSATTEVTGTGTALKLQDNAAQTFTQDFTNDTGFTYDSDKTEFVAGKMQQKDCRPANATFYAPYSDTIGIDAAWGGGTLTGTPFLGANVVSNKLDLNYDDIRYVEYSAVNNGDSQQVGCIRLRITPNYAGLPSSTKNIYSVFNTNASNVNNITIYHATDRTLRFLIYDSIGNLVSLLVGTWNQNQGQRYEIELNWDITTGASRIFLDGVQTGATDTNTGTRSSSINIIRVGTGFAKGTTSDFSIEDVLLFSTVQHTSNYTPDWSDICEYIYARDVITLPNFSYSGAGSIQSYNSFATTESNTPRYTVNGKYYNGSAWVASSDTFETASTQATVNANISSLTAADTVSLKMLWDNSNSVIMDIDQLVTGYTGQVYPLTNPRVDILPLVLHTDLISFVETVVEPGSDEVRWMLSKEINYYYWNGAAWVISNETYAQSSSGADVVANIGSFNALNENLSTSVAFFLHSNTGITTPEAQSIEIEYDFVFGLHVTPGKCLVYGYIKDDGTAIANATIDVVAEPDQAVYGDDQVQCIADQQTTSDVNGFWSVLLVETTNMDVTFKFTITCPTGETNTYYRKIPNELSKNFSEL
jgi:hypothetical protein